MPAFRLSETTIAGALAEARRAVTRMPVGDDARLRINLLVGEALQGLRVIVGGVDETRALLAAAGAL